MEVAYGAHGAPAIVLDRGGGEPGTEGYRPAVVSWLATQEVEPGSIFDTPDGGAQAPRAPGEPVPPPREPAASLEPAGIYYLATGQPVVLIDPGDGAPGDDGYRAAQVAELWPRQVEPGSIFDAPPEQDEPARVAPVSPAEQARMEQTGAVAAPAVEPATGAGDLGPRSGEPETAADQAARSTGGR